MIFSILNFWKFISVDNFVGKVCVKFVDKIKSMIFVFDVFKTFPNSRFILFRILSVSYLSGFCICVEPIFSR